MVGTEQQRQRQRQAQQAQQQQQRQRQQQQQRQRQCGWRLDSISTYLPRRLAWKLIRVASDILPKER